MKCPGLDRNASINATVKVYVPMMDNATKAVKKDGSDLNVSTVCFLC